MYTVEHIGIAVKSLEQSDPLFSRLLDASPYKHEEVLEQGVITSFFQAGQAKIELLEATHPDSPIANFIHPRSANGVLIEICQTIPEAELTVKHGLDL